MTFSSLGSPHFPKGGEMSCYRQTLLKSSAPERKDPQMRELLVHTEGKNKKENKRNMRDTHEITEAISTWIQRGREEQQMGEKDD